MTISCKWKSYANENLEQMGILYNSKFYINLYTCETNTKFLVSNDQCSVA